MTVTEMSPSDFPGEIAASYSQACTTLGVPSADGGYGLVLDQDESGARWTRVTTDVQGIRTAESFGHMGVEYGYEPPEGTVIVTLPGWPVYCTLCLAGLPEPHDPPGAIRAQEPPEQVPLRRSLADYIADELAHTGHQDAAQYAEAERWHALEMGDTDLEPVPRRLIDLRQPPSPAAQAITDRALSEAWNLAAAANPPLGSVRARESWPSGQVIRASGDDWTLVARTGTPPLLVLLVDNPGRLLDVSDTDQASALLDALATAASRTAGS